MPKNATQTRTGAAITFLVAVGAVSAGVHAGLAPEHLHEWAPLGVSFIAAAVAVAAAVAALAVRPLNPWLPALLAALFGGLAAAYALTRIAALPPLDPDREAPDLLGVCTSALEAVGLLVAIRLSWLPKRRPFPVTRGGTA
jgi:hypothetical protein